MIQGIVIWLLFHGSLFSCFAEQADQGRDFYTAAVFESVLAHDNGDDIDTAKAKNLKIFQQAADAASQKGVDIIVFHEYGIFQYPLNRTLFGQFSENVPDPKHGLVNPCNTQHEFADRPVLLTLSCLAQKKGIYVVGNVGDKQPCTTSSQTCDLDDVDKCVDSPKKCPEDGNFLFNTDVAFDRQGTLIAKYHKVHPYFEMVDIPHNPYPTIFQTEFGTFALIVCFDSVFKEPVQLVEKHGVENVIFPTFWFDDILPINAIEWQQAWALSNKVNYLAANGHQPGTATLGSGIYSKDLGALAYTYNPDGESKLLVARVPLRNKSSPNQYSGKVSVLTKNGFEEREETGESFPDDCYRDAIEESDEKGTDYICTKRQMRKYSLVKLEGREGKYEICVNGLCCSISYSAESMDEDYFFAAFNGTNDVRDFHHWGEENCFLIRCDAAGDMPCATLPRKSSTVFKSLEIRARTTANRVYPVVTERFYRLATKAEWDFNFENQVAILKYKSQRNMPLLKAGFLGRCYDRDPRFVPYFK